MVDKTAVRAAQGYGVRNMRLLAYVSTDRSRKPSHPQKHKADSKGKKKHKYFRKTLEVSTI